MGSARLKFFIFIIYIPFLIFFGCSSNEEDKEAPIDIKGMHINQVYNRTPQDTSEQVDLELYGEVAKENLNQDILYEWNVQYKKIDINKEVIGNIGNNNSQFSEEYSEATDDVEQIFDKNQIKTKKDPYSDYFFINTSNKEPLHAILSIYHPGYYIVSLEASNIQESKIYSVMVKVGNPDIPHLFLKVNVPKFKSLKKKDAKGSFFIKYNNEDAPIHSKNFTEISAADMGLDWYDTGIIINPFSSFNIKAGTHILDDNEKTLSVISNSNLPIDTDGIIYQFGNEEDKIFNNNSAIIDAFSEDNILSIFKKGKIKWAYGNVYTDILIWKTDNNNKDKFTFIENSLSNKNTRFSVFLENAYLIKMFIGSYGHRVPYNKYFVYFGPQGTEADELDPKGEREFPALPYGYLLGKLGKTGAIFPIGNNFSYKHLFKYDLYEKTELDNFVLVHKKYIAQQQSEISLDAN